MSPMFKEGHVFNDLEGKGYILTRDVFEGDYIRSTDFVPFGGAPEPIAGDPVPDWLNKLIKGVSP